MTKCVMSKGSEIGKGRVCGAEAYLLAGADRSREVLTCALHARG